MNTRDTMREYASHYGLPWTETENRPVDIRRAVLLARYYQNAHHTPRSTVVATSYHSLARELVLQYEWLVASGLTFEPWRGTGEPYDGSEEMLGDLETGHLWYLPTSTSGALPASHPMARVVTVSTGRYSVTGQWLVNDLFRAVHDAVGHGVYGWSFGPRGEDNAYRTHKGTLTARCHLALCCETRAQNSWFNYGPHIVRADGTVPAKGDQDYTAPCARPFAPQRATSLPRAFIQD